MGLALIGLLAGDGTTRPRVAADVRQVYLELTAQELMSAYAVNEIAADQKYKGKMVRLSGKVDDIGKDIMGTPYVTGASAIKCW